MTMTTEIQIKTANVNHLAIIYMEPKTLGTTQKAFKYSIFVSWILKGLGSW